MGVCMNKMGVLFATLALAACANGSPGMGLGAGGGTTGHGGNGTGGASSTSSSSGTDGGASSTSSGHASSSSSTSSTSSSGMVVCNAQNCATSCCLGPMCSQYGMTDDQACGLQGQECMDCTVYSQACIDGCCQ